MHSNHMSGANNCRQASGSSDTHRDTCVTLGRDDFDKRRSRLVSSQELRVLFTPRRICMLRDSLLSSHSSYNGFGKNVLLEVVLVLGTLISCITS